MNPLDILARLQPESTSKPTDAELTAAYDGIKDALDAATSPETMDAELAPQLSEALKVIKAEQDARDAAAAETAAEMAKLREGIFDTEAPAEEAPAEEAPAEEAPAEDRVPVAASADLVARLTTSLKSRVPATEERSRMDHAASLKAIGPASGYELDADAGFRELGHVFGTHGKSVMTAGNGVPLVRLSKSFSDDRKLGSNVDQNNRRIADLLGTGSISKPFAASGGICGPGDVDHSHPICSQRGRPVRDSLPQFNASRGTVTYSPSISIGDLAGNVSIWTAATDADPQANTKPCPPLECPEELSASVDAVVKCVTVGNFQAIFSPEWWAANLEVLATAHDREAEQKAISEIHAASTNVGTINERDTLYNFFTAVRNIVSADRSARRNWDGRYTVVADAYGRDQIANQLVTNLGTGVGLDSINQANQLIDSWFADLNVEVVWTYDGTLVSGTTHRVLPVGAATPDTFGFYVYPEDAFLFLDGGTLDLGTQITDSTLNATNDRQAFAETFEKVAFRGCSSYRGVVTINNVCGCSDLGSL